MSTRLVAFQNNSMYTLKMLWSEIHLTGLTTSEYGEDNYRDFVAADTSEPGSSRERYDGWYDLKQA